LNKAKLSPITFVAVLFAISCLRLAGQPAAGTNATSPTKVHDPNRIESIPIEVLPSGFAQPAFQLPQGSYALVLLNRTGFRNLQVILERMPSSSVNGVAASQVFGSQVAATNGKGLQSVKLSPGTYRLRVDAVAAWVCQITVN
jgi:hypothetical protein